MTIANGLGKNTPKLGYFKYEASANLFLSQSHKSYLGSLPTRAAHLTKIISQSIKDSILKTITANKYS